MPERCDKRGSRTSLTWTKGYIKLKDDATITATVNDIAENPHNIKFQEIEAAQLPNALKDVDYAVINSNYAIEADLNPVKDSLAIEGSSSAYSNILAVKEGKEKTDAIKALKAALESKEVADFIADKYNGSVVSVVENPGDGYDSSVVTVSFPALKLRLRLLPHPTPKYLRLQRRFLRKRI